MMFNQPLPAITYTTALTASGVIRAICKLRSPSDFISTAAKLLLTLIKLITYDVERMSTARAILNRLGYFVSIGDYMLSLSQILSF